MREKRPYIIWTPAFRNNSGGIKVMHRLCHLLNKRGYEAYVTNLPNFQWAERVIVSQAHFDKIKARDAIIVYPEIVSGNPLKGDTVARYVLNQPGKIGGDIAYDKSEIVFVHNTPLERYIPKPFHRLYITYVEDFFVDEQLPREGAVLYVGKGRDMCILSIKLLRM